jgi:TM2 domain-containing membrane protein YozV
MKKKDKIIESILWSIALPGFPQLLNGRLVKGILFIGLEFVINVMANFNEIIRLSFIGNIEDAVSHTNYQWLMFYPCLYFFAMWDAFKDAGGGEKPYSYLPFVSSAFLVTVGIMYSAQAKIFGILLGSVWFPMLCVIPGLIIGFSLKIILSKVKEA